MLNALSLCLLWTALLQCHAQNLNAVYYQSSNNVTYIDIVITVKTHIKFVSTCVEALVRHAPDPIESNLQQRVIFVDDGSPAETIAFEHALCAEQPMIFFCAATEGKERGYTWAVEKGIHFLTSIGLKASYAVVLLNSDTIVTEGWLQGMHATLAARSKTMIVGPLSNAATWQSVPFPQLAQNIFPLGLSVDTLAEDIQRGAREENHPSVSLFIINGFCFMFKREVLSHIGGFDTANFGTGYGEEVDFSLRSYRKGFEARIVPSVYVFHTKTASFAKADKSEFSTHGHVVLDAKYKKELDKFKSARFKARDQLQAVCENVEKTYTRFASKLQVDIHPKQQPHVLYVLTKAKDLMEVLNLWSMVFYMRSKGIEAGLVCIDWESNGLPPMTELLQIHFPYQKSPDDLGAIMNMSQSDFNKHFSHSYEKMHLKASRHKDAKRLWLTSPDVIIGSSMDVMNTVTKVYKHFADVVHRVVIPIYLVHDFPTVPSHSSSQQSDHTLYSTAMAALNASIHLFTPSEVTLLYIRHL